MTRLRRLVDLFLGPSEDQAAPVQAPPAPKKTVKFGEKTISGDVPRPVAVNVFLGHVGPSDIQILMGVSSFLTEEVTPLSVFVLSPQKVKELRDFLTKVIQAYDAKFGVPNPSDDPNSPPIPLTILH